MHILSETLFNKFRDVPPIVQPFESSSSEILTELDSFKEYFDRRENTALLVEDQLPTAVFYLLQGRVKLSMNSSAGRRLILGIAYPGDTLGLAASLFGSKYDITAETLTPCKFASINRVAFLAFLSRNPSAYRNVVRELCIDRTRAHEQLRTLGVASGAPAKLARFLLEWCADGQKTERGTRLSCSFTHDEIAEFIGTSRETVSRIFKEFRYHDLLESRGATLIVSNRKALEVYAGIEALD
jgi:CRP/FNR family transcriptional regulator